LTVSGGGENSGSVQSLRREVEQHPDDADARLQLGTALAESGQLAEALGHLQRSVELDPSLVRGHIRLGNLLRELSRTGEAVEAYGCALELRPGDPFILSNLGNAWLDLSEISRAIDCYRESLRIYPDAPTTHSNLIFAMQYDSDTSREEIATAHRDWGGRFGQALGQAELPDRQAFDGRRPMRVGFLSADFRYHPVGRMASALWRNLDRDRVMPVVYDNSADDSPAKRRYREQVAQWHSIAALPDAAVTERIRADRLDVLIDLSGHTSGNRLAVLAQKPAPVQATLFAYPNTTGLSAVDWRITDSVADPPGADPCYAEQLLRLPSVAWVYDAPEKSPEPVGSPCLGGEPFTFGCLNNPAKISAATVETWSAILRACSGARITLLVRDDSAHEGLLLAKFERHGIGAGQLLFTAKGPERDYLESHNRIDLMLDPFPYNGGVTTGDCLWMGTPILALEGDSYVSRQGVSLLSSVGLPELIAADREELVAKAAGWCAVPEHLAKLGGDLRGKLQRSPLMDHAGYARELTEALERIVTA
jgi:predicted O-linked N-acetylglucosamine transferase (SPINDLY family)